MLCVDTYLESAPFDPKTFVHKSSGGCVLLEMVCIVIIVILLYQR